MSETINTELHNITILLVDDEEAIGEFITRIAAEARASVLCALSIATAKQVCAQNNCDVAIVDMMLLDESGLDLIRHLQQAYPHMAIIAITGNDNAAIAHALEEARIQSVLIKPFSAAQVRFSICKELSRRRQLLKEGVFTPLTVVDDDHESVGLVGESSYMAALREKVRLFASGTMPVLIVGPTGSGKEIIARAIHRLSPRSMEPMITVNSSAIPEQLEESEFFGHARGAFTGAHTEKDGIIKCADQSSLFLDEVGELSLRIQAKLLRVLDGHDYARIGDTKPVHSDVRFISATNRPLTDMIKSGQFREDLYYRLKACVVETQPLAAHADDVPALVRHFLFEFGEAHKKQYLITGEALSALSRYTWPGNIRELKHVVNSLCSINSRTRTITRESIEWVLTGLKNSAPPPEATLTTAKQTFQKSFFVDLLVRHKGNISHAAHEADIDRAHLSRKLKVLGVNAADFKSKS